MADTIQCPGCHAAVAVIRPAGVGYSVRKAVERGQDRIVIVVGRVVVHCCTRCLDVEWR
jgi:hypothetical protein